MYQNIAHKMLDKLRSQKYTLISAMTANDVFTK